MAFEEETFCKSQSFKRRRRGRKKSEQESKRILQNFAKIVCLQFVFKARRGEREARVNFYLEKKTLFFWFILAPWYFIDEAYRSMAYGKLRVCVLGSCKEP